MASRCSNFTKLCPLLHIATGCAIGDKVVEHAPLPQCDVDIVAKIPRNETRRSSGCTVAGARNKEFPCITLRLCSMAPYQCFSMIGDAPGQRIMRVETESLPCKATRG